MKKILFTMLGLLAFLFASIGVNAGSNNGYTTAANVYSGSSSRTWYGGGVQHALALWRMEADVAAKQKAVVEEAIPASSDGASPDSTETTNSEAEAAPSAETQVSVDSAEIQPEVTSEATPESPTPPTAPSINE